MFGRWPGWLSRTATTTDSEVDSAEDGGAAHLALARESLRELIDDSRLPAGVRESLADDLPVLTRPKAAMCRWPWVSLSSMVSTDR